MNNNKKVPAKGTGLNHFTGNSSRAQRGRLLSVLLHRSVTTFEARKELDIPSPAPRVFELRAEGHRIVTHWCSQAMESGKTHRIARYVLLSTPGGHHGGS